jgi:5S rRNA maturation endonuclease (ribonuclease M5)
VQWQTALRANQPVLDRIYELKGIKREVLEACSVGWGTSRAGTEKRFQLLIRDGNGKLVNVVSYVPNGDPKALALKGRPRDLFPAPETIDGIFSRIGGEPIASTESAWIVEGESDALSMLSVDLPAISVPGTGSVKSFRRQAHRFRRFKRVNVLRDCDAPGRKAAEEIAAALFAEGIEARVLDLDPSRTDGYDVGDLLGEAVQEGDAATAAARTMLQRMAGEAPVWTPRGVPLATPVSIASIAPRTSWPAPLSDVAYVGLAGEIVRAVEPETEADPAALLALLLAAFGNACGRCAGWYVGGTFHATNLFLAIVGDTSSGRKGTGWDAIRPVFDLADATWTRERVQSGLSSGEGLIHAVRDATLKEVPVKENGRPTGEYISEIEDVGVQDKRLLAREGEFASVLRVMRRDGNTLSATIRNLWDSGNVRTLTKGKPEAATGALVSIVGDVTPDELRRELDDTSAANGFANRFLFVAARRSKSLPFGGQPVALEELAERVKLALKAASVLTEVEFDAEARAIWPAEYERLTRGTPGLLGAVTGRAAPQVRRLATIYALMDCSGVVKASHLRAALELWRYCFDSARYVFGTRLGDNIADRLLDALREAPQGMTRSDMRDVLGRKVPGDRIATALEMLAESGLAESVRETTGGRPAERWHASAVEEREERVGKPQLTGLSYVSYVSSTPSTHTASRGGSDSSRAPSHVDEERAA